MTAYLPPIGPPSSALGKPIGIVPTKIEAYMSAFHAVALGDVLEVYTADVASGTGAWEEVSGLLSDANTVLGNKIHAVALESCSAAAIIKVGFVGDFLCHVDSGMNTAAVGRALIANSTANATSNVSSATAGNYLMSIATIVSSQASSVNNTDSPLDGRKVLGYLISSANVTSATGSAIVRFHGFGWGNAQRIP